MSQEAVVRSREEDDELQCSTKKVKESHQRGSSSDDCSPRLDGERTLYKERLLGEVPSAYEEVFHFDNDMETEVVFDDESSDIAAGLAVVNLSGETKARIRALWANALIVKVFGNIVGYHFFITCLTNLWKPSGRLDCVDLGKDFFLIHFSLQSDYGRVLKDGPWFVGGHYLPIRNWEANFRPSTTNVSSVAILIRLPLLPIEYYDLSVLRDICKAIRPVLRIDRHTAVKTRGWSARIYMQISLDKPLIKLLKIGGIGQPVQYEGINSMCFSCGRVGHKVDGCPYTIRAPEKESGK
ncbi:uncharacterized protein LOC115951558 [Quercus lobata]|uniref:uncharacterized protein LOC115951558 n=1 Tax=Quercus lobata TaxID=97700 RepID=UPI0012474114|nr:uncharacterized protein LOC115951558 [Quercus lobata]